MLTSPAQLVSPVAPVAMKVRTIAAAQGFQKAVSCPAFATSTKWLFGNSGRFAFVSSSETTSRSELRISVGVLGNGWFGGKAGFGSTGAGHGTHQSGGKPPGTPFGRRPFTASQAAAENGAKASRGRAATAASYCARRVASGALVSYGKRPSEQNFATEAPAEKKPGSPESVDCGLSAASRKSGTVSPPCSARAAAVSSPWLRNGGSAGSGADRMSRIVDSST